MTKRVVGFRRGRNDDGEEMVDSIELIIIIIIVQIISWPLFQASNTSNDT